MMSLSSLLRTEHGFVSGGPASGGPQISIDSAGVITEAGGRGEVSLQDVFRPGCSVSMDLAGGRLMVLVTGSNKDGVEVVSTIGETGFLPWETIAGVVRSSRQIDVGVLSARDEISPDEKPLVAAELARLRGEIARAEQLIETYSRLVGKLERLSSEIG